MQVNPVNGAAALFNNGDATSSAKDSAGFAQGIPTQQTTPDPLAAVEAALANLLASLSSPDPPPNIQLNKANDSEAKGTQQTTDLKALAGGTKNDLVAKLLGQVPPPAINDLPQPATGAGGASPPTPTSSKFGPMALFSGQGRQVPTSPKFGPMVLFSGGGGSPPAGVSDKETTPPLGIPDPNGTASQGIPLPIPPKPGAVPANKVDVASQTPVISVLQDGVVKATDVKPVSKETVWAIRDLARKLLGQGVPVDKIVATLQSIPTENKDNVLATRVDALTLLLKQWTKSDNDAAILQIRKDFIAPLQLGAPQSERADRVSASPAAPVNDVLAAVSTAAKAATQTTVEPAKADFREQIIQQVTNQIKEMMDAKLPRQITIRLDPPELGTLNLTVRTVGQRVEATIVAGNADVKALIDGNRAQLVKALENHGLELGSMFVGHQNASKSEHFKEMAASRNPSWRPESASTTSVSAMSPAIAWSRSGVDMKV